MRRRIGLAVLVVGIAGVLVYWAIDQRERADVLAMQVDAITEELAEIETWEPPKPAPDPALRQWTVLEAQVHRGEHQGTLLITYLDSTGKERVWRRDLPYGDDPGIQAVYDCWAEARLGQALPLCARSGY